MMEHIEYRKGDRNILLNRLTKFIDMETGSPMDPSTIPYTYVEMFRENIQISVDFLLDIVLWDPSRDVIKLSNSGFYFKILFELIHYAPLRLIPLYINSVPEVAKWRLEIGR